MTGTHVCNCLDSLYDLEVTSVLSRWEDRRSEGLKVLASRPRRKRENERVLGDSCDT
jgi:hypothetical protein